MLHKPMKYQVRIPRFWGIFIIMAVDLSAEEKIVTKGTFFTKLLTTPLVYDIIQIIKDKEI